MKHRKTEKRWTPFTSENAFRDWFAGQMDHYGIKVFYEPSFRPSSLETGNTIARRRSDVALLVPDWCNSLKRDLFLIVEIKAGDNARYLRQAHRQIRGAMFGHDWRCEGNTIQVGRRPWRGLVLTPGQLHRPFWPDVVAPDSDTGPRPVEMWEVLDRQLTEDGASFIWQDETVQNQWWFWAHNGKASMEKVWIRGGPDLGLSLRRARSPLDPPWRWC